MRSCRGGEIHFEINIRELLNDKLVGQNTQLFIRHLLTYTASFILLYIKHT